MYACALWAGVGDESQLWTDAQPEGSEDIFRTEWQRENLDCREQHLS